MRLRTRLVCIERLSRVSGACQDGAREFTEKSLRLAKRLSGVAEKLTGSWEGLTTTVKRSYRPHMDPGSSLGIRPRLGRCRGSSLGVR
ncbi:hypothetical protein B296_00039578 [Ensete ventricosum]|uniref:Uncharacterized protein n=1 Tax=Ensete ventricosum TaxID=4639 RepID=A0A426WX76_ENSVE|nr:hypothetical protein B296_00039578 [Ensete ventricosum]